MKTEERIKILKEMRLENLRNAAMYQRLSVSGEHWHTPRKEAYRNSSISCKKRSTALWWAIKLMLNSVPNVQESDTTEAE